MSTGAVKTGARLFLLVLAVTLLTAMLALAALMFTERGTRWLISQAQPLVPGNLRIGQVSGTLGAHLTLENVHYSAEFGAVELARAELRWSASALFGDVLRVEQLILTDADVILVPSSADSPTQSGASLPELDLPDLPLDVEVLDFALHDLSVTELLTADATSGRTLLGIPHLGLHVEVQESAWQVQRMDLDMALGDIEVDAHLVGTAVDETPLQVASTAEVHIQVPDLPELVLDLSAQGDAEDLAMTISANAPYNIVVDGSLGLLGSGTVDLQARLDALQPAAIVAQVPVQEISGQIDVSGEFTGLEILLDLSARTDFGDMVLVGRAVNETDHEMDKDPRLLLDDLDLRFVETGGQVTVAGVLRAWDTQRMNLQTQDPDVDLTITWQQLVWPLKPTLQTAEIVRSVAGELTLAGTPEHYELAARGQLVLGANDLSESDTGAYQTDAVNSDAGNNVSPGAVHRGDFVLRGQGSTTHLEVAQLDLQVLEGAIAGTADLDWADGISGDFRLQASDLNPGALSGTWPGRLDLQITGQAGGAETPDIRMVIAGQGELRDLPVTLDVQGYYRDATLQIETANLSSGSFALDAAGRLGAASDFQWRVAGEDLSDLLPSAGGRVESEGRITGPFQQPDVQFSVQGNTLRYGQNHVGMLTVEGQVGALGTTASDVHVVAETVQVATQAIGKLQVNASGSLPGHEITLQLEADAGTTEVAWSGAWSGALSRALSRAWSGAIAGATSADNHYQFNLRRVQIALPGQPLYVLQEPVEGLVMPGGVRLPRTCFTGAQTRLCMAADTSQAAAPADLLVERLPLSLLQPLLPAQLQLRGYLDGEIALQHWLALETLRGAGELALVDVELLGEQPAEDDDDEATAASGGGAAASKSADPGRLKRLLAFAPGHIEFNAEPSDLRMLLSLPLLSSGIVGGNVRVHGANQSVEGGIDIDLPTVDFLSPFLNDVAPVVIQAGQFLVDLDLTGTLAEPRVQGELSMQGGRLNVPDLNTTYADVGLEISADDQGTVTLRGQATSGGGTLGLQGRVQQAFTSPVAALSLQGENFQVANTGAAVVRVSPDVRAEVSPDKIKLTGRVAVPVAQIVLNTLPVSAKTVNADQVLIAPDGSVTGNSRGPAVSANLELLLGDSVSFAGQGLEATFSGGLTVKETPGEPTTASGQITVKEGVYQAYGQDLAIEDGKLIWVGGPLAEPGLDILATRTPRPDVTVGIRARGSLNRPEITLTSRPAMPESDQLSYLVLGRPLQDNSSAESSYLNKAALALGIRGGTYLTEKYGSQLGFDQIGIETEPGEDVDQAALVVGKYLTPRLYVSYGLGLLESVSTFKMEYSLSERWRLTTESSAEQSGGDLVFSVERD